MSSKFEFSLSHVGLFVTDLDKMVDFYTRFMGFIVSDRGPHLDREIAFLTRDPAEHHQLVLSSGRPADQAFNNLNQISFRVDGLDTLRRIETALKVEGVKMLGAISHGNSLSVYFHDPEGNRVEFLTGTAWYVPQPFGVPVDLTKPDKELWSAVKEAISGQSGYKSHEAWKKDIEQRLAAR